MPIEYISNIQTGNYTRPIKDREAWKLFAGSWLKDKDICMYGDSTLVVDGNYADIITASGICNSVTKRAVSGHTLTNNGYPIIRDATDLGNFDYVFVCYGINDWSGITKYNWKNAVRATALNIISKGTQPVFVFPWLVYIPATASGGWINNKGCSMDAFVDAGISICKELNVKYFNLYTMSGVTKTNYAEMLTPSANGYYLHEGQKLSELVAKLIVNGNFNGDTCLGGAFNQPSKNILPTNFGFITKAQASAIITSVIPVEFRKGRVTCITDRQCEFAGLSSGRRVKVSGYCGVNTEGGYVTISAKNLYNNNVDLICRVDSASDFEFTFEPPQGGGCWAFVCTTQTESIAVIMDFTIASENGTTRVVSNSPGVASLQPTYESDFTPHDECNLIFLDSGSVEMTGFTGVIEGNHAAGLRWSIGALPFYPQRPIYGFALIDGSVKEPAMFRISQSGTIAILLPSAYTGGTLIRFSGINITPSDYFMPNVDV